MLMRRRQSLLDKQAGLSTLEYIILAAVLALGIVGAATYLRGKTQQSLQKEGDAIEKVAGGDSAEVGNTYQD